MLKLTRMKGVIAVAVVAAALVAGVACSNNGDESPTPTSEPTNPPVSVVTPGQVTEPTSGVSEPVVSPGVPVVSPPIPISVPPSPSVEASRDFGYITPQGVQGYSVIPQFSGTGQQTGIWVVGQAIINLEPDLAMLNLGVEATGKTVEEARGQAASAMDAIINALHDRGIEDKDIKTQFFNIWPMYEYREVFEEGRRVGKQELVGYRVNNTTSVKIRDMDAIGEIIDEAAEAGGDVTRINGISFTVEDPKALEGALREAATEDAIAKARQFAELTGVEIDGLVFIAEIGGGSPVVQDYARGAVAELAAPAPTTPISAGETQLSMAVQAVFSILQ